jgi:1-acyl-sn-glycerol-3-phosphate acyltransferase
MCSSTSLFAAWGGIVRMDACIVTSGTGNAFPKDTGNSQLVVWSKPMPSLLAKLLLKLFGWRRIGRLPDVPKYLIVFAPHTSNWDLPIGYMVARAFKLHPNWLGKHFLFRPPFGTFFSWIGGIPVDRRARNNAVEQAIQAFHSRNRLALAITPEGTRNQADEIKLMPGKIDD